MNYTLKHFGGKKNCRAWFGLLTEGCLTEGRPHNDETTTFKISFLFNFKLKLINRITNIV